MVRCCHRLLTIVMDRVFVLTLLWAGFVLGISFMATPLKFQAPSLTLPVAMEIAFATFHALNALEIGLAIVILAIVFVTPSRGRTRLVALLSGLLLTIQTLLLYTVLDARTVAIIKGTEASMPSFHSHYVGLEISKLALLFYLAHLQIEEREAKIRTATRGGDSSNQTPHSIESVLEPCGQ